MSVSLRALVYAWTRVWSFVNCTWLRGISYRDASKRSPLPYFLIVIWLCLSIAPIVFKALVFVVEVSVCRFAFTKGENRTTPFLSKLDSPTFSPLRRLSIVDQPKQKETVAFLKMNATLDRNSFFTAYWSTQRNILDFNGIFDETEADISTRRRRIKLLKSFRNSRRNLYLVHRSNWSNWSKKEKKKREEREVRMPIVRIYTYIVYVINAWRERENV